MCLTTDEKVLALIMPQSPLMWLSMSAADAGTSIPVIPHPMSQFGVTTLMTSRSLPLLLAEWAGSDLGKNTTGAQCFQCKVQSLKHTCFSDCWLSLVCPQDAEM